MLMQLCLSQWDYADLHSSTDLAAAFDVHTNFEGNPDLPALYSLETRLEVWWDKDSQGDLLHFCCLKIW